MTHAQRGRRARHLATDRRRLNITPLASDSSGAVATTFTRRMTCAAASGGELARWGGARRGAADEPCRPDHATVRPFASWRDGGFLRLDWQELPSDVAIACRRWKHTFVHTATTAATVNASWRTSTAPQRGGGWRVGANAAPVCAGFTDDR